MNTLHRLAVTAAKAVASATCLGKTTTLAMAAATLLSQAALAQSAASVTVHDAWVRATVQGQKASGAFMRLTSASGSRLKSASSPVAAVAQVHAMRMEGDIMKMQALPEGLELPAGKTVELKPGGYHLMLMDLKMALKKDSSIPVTLVFVDARGVESRSALQLPVRSMAPVAHGHAAEHSPAAPCGAPGLKIDRQRCR